jgi:hypothetical protein
MKKLSLEYIKGYLKYYSFHDNLHNHNFISPILCFIGRHDYEVWNYFANGNIDLMCMECGKIKNTVILKNNDAP